MAFFCRKGVTVPTTMALCLLLTTLVLFSLKSSLVTSLSCPMDCTCRWKGGKETAECVGKRLEKIPSGLSRGTQVLDISKNNLKLLRKEAFYHAGLTNLQKVYMAECKIRKIDDNAFRHLANLVELDLSGNLLIAVPSETFVDYPELRRLMLSNNVIRRIESNAFIKLPSLALLEISKCRVEYVGPKAFYGLNSLQHLKLDRNCLTTLPADVGFPIKSLLSLDLYDNRWDCDCELRVLRNWLVNDDLPVNAQPVCTTPKRLEGKQLVQTSPEEFACPPQASSYLLVAQAYLAESAKLVCSVQADPSPEIRWSRHGKVILNLTRIMASSRTYTIHEQGNTDKMSILAISSVMQEDAGEYLCVAENLAGPITVNVTLDVIQRSLEASSLTNGHIAGISIALILVSAVTIVFICVLLAKMRSQQSEETKHLQLDKNKSVHLVNHVKFDVTKEKLEMTTGNSVHKPLCSIVNANYNSNTPVQENFNLEDTTGGSFKSSGMGSNKPDVVNFTCVLRSPLDDNDDDDDDNHKNCDTQIQLNLTQPRIEDVSHLQSTSNDYTICTYDSDKYFSLTRTEPDQGLRDYVQLYEECAKGMPDCCEVVEKRELNLEPRGAHYENESEWMRTDASTMAPNRHWYKNPDGVDAEKQVTVESFQKLQEQSNETDNWRRIHECANNGASRNSNKVVKGSTVNKRYGPLGNAPGILKHVNLHGKNYVPVLPPLPAHHFAQARDSPDEGYEDEVEEEMDM